MKLLLFTDIHFSNVHRNKLEEAVKTSEWVINQAEIKKPDLIIFLGDLFETPETDAELLYIVKNFILTLSNISPIKLLTGNHEILNEEENKNLLYQVFNGFHNIEVIGYDLGYKIDFIKEEHLFLNYIPYYKSKDTLIKVLNTVANSVRNRKNENSISFLFGHFDLLNTSYIELSQIDINKPVDIKDFNEFYGVFDKIFLGHVHSRIVSINNKVEYIGSTHNQNFKALDKKSKGIVILEINNGKYTEKFIENPYNPIYKTINSVEEFNNFPFDFDTKNYYIEFNIKNTDVNLLNKNFLLKLIDKKYRNIEENQILENKENIDKNLGDFNKLVINILQNNIQMLPDDYQNEILIETQDLLDLP